MSIATTQRSERFAILMLVIACAFWGMSFNWNKEAQHFLGQRWAAATADSAAEKLGPATFLAIRFPIAAALWLIIFPRARQAWTRLVVYGGVAGGLFLSVGMLFQHYGLALTSESLSAFLTSLTILFTPILAAFVLRHRVSPALWLAVGVATFGIALMTVYRDEGRFELGAALGLLCAVVFSGHILVVDWFGKRVDPWSFTLAQFLTASVVFVLFTLLYSRANLALAPTVLTDAMKSGKFLLLTSATVVFSTLVTFGLMFRYQPLTTPTRAALVYLIEPVFATAYAWFAADRSLDAGAIVGGVLIIAANAGAEFASKPKSQAHPEPV